MSSSDLRLTATRLCAWVVFRIAVSKNLRPEAAQLMIMLLTAKRAAVRCILPHHHYR